MKPHAIEDEKMIRFLLGELSPQEHREIEERFFHDDQFFEELLALEDQLITDYVKGLLDSSQREKFESICLSSPERRQRVEFARDLAKTISRHSNELLAGRVPPKRSWFGWPHLRLLFAAPRLASVLGAVLVLVAGAWFVRNILHLRSEISELQHSRANLQQTESELRQRLHSEQSHAEELSRRLERTRVQRDELDRQLALLRDSQSTVLSLILVPGSPRGLEDAPRLTILPKATSVRLVLERGDIPDYRQYQATIRSVEGDVRIQVEDLRAAPRSAGRSFTARISPSVLRAGDYILTLRGSNSPGLSDELADYYFHVIREPVR